jgi:PAS domain S-box-containing protein
MNENKSYEEFEEEIIRLKNELNTQQLRFEKEYLKLKLHSKQTALPIIDWNLDSQVTFWNEASEKLFGYSSSEAIGKKAEEFIVPIEAKKQIAEFWQKTLTKKVNTSIVTNNITKSGEKVYCEWYYTPIINDNGEVISVTSIVLDITNAERAELKLIESENRFKVLSNASFEGIFLLDNGICIEANETGCQLFGYPYHEIIGMHALEVIAEEDRKTVKDNISKGISEAYEVIGLKKDRSTFHAEIQGKNLMYKGKEVRISAVRDISKRKKAQKELYESETKFKSIFEHSGDGILIGNNQGIIVEANTSFCKMTEYKHDELVGKHLKILFYKEPLSNNPFQLDLLNNGQPIIIEREIISKKGIPILIEMNSKRLDENYLIASFRDLTERQKTEQVIRESNKQLKLAKEKAEYSDRLKSEFLANMSHEIRTPMNGIMGFSEMLNEPGIDNATIKYYTNIIANCSDQLRRIIDDILEISELETKQIKVVYTKVCINSLLQELFEIYDTKAKENNTPLYLNITLKDKESTIYTDESKLRKILNNLIDNALHYTSEGYIEVGYELKNAALKFYVKDTGIGIKPEMQHLIFERFSQEDKSLSRQYGGLGLGLSIAKENSELLGGSICVDSVKGQGSVFYFTIPYKKIHDSNSDNDNLLSDMKKVKEFTILVAEDEEVNFLYLEVLFQKLKNNYTVRRAKTGEEAIREFELDDNIDLILMDIKMPGMDGLEATKEIRKLNPDIPIIAQTAYSRIEDKEKALEAGCNDFLSKPISQKTFIDTLNIYLNIKDNFLVEY